MADIGTLIKNDYFEVDKRDEVRRVLGWLVGERKEPPVVVDRDRPYGIITDRAMMRHHVQQNAKIENYTLPTGALSVTTPLHEAASRMAEHRAAYLPVIDERDKTAGYVRAVDVARAQGRELKAGDICFPMGTLKESQTMGEAINVFNDEHIDILPVLREDGRVAGVLPRRTVLTMELNAQDKGRKDAGGEKIRVHNDPVRGFLDETPPPFLSPGADFESVLETLEERGYALVGERNERLVGIITPETIFRAGGV